MEQQQQQTTAVDSGVLLGNVLKALFGWALMFFDVVPWETAVAALSIDPAELAMQALEGKGEGEEAVVVDGEALREALELPPQASTTAGGGGDAYA